MEHDSCAAQAVQDGRSKVLAPEELLDLIQRLLTTKSIACLLGVGWVLADILYSGCANAVVKLKHLFGLVYKTAAYVLGFIEQSQS